MVQDFETLQSPSGHQFQNSSRIFTEKINQFLRENQQCCCSSRSAVSLSSSQRSNSSSTTSLVDMNKENDNPDDIEVAEKKPQSALNHGDVGMDTKSLTLKSQEHHLNSLSNTIRDLLNDLVLKNKVAVIDEEAVIKSALSWNHSLASTPSPLFLVSRNDLLQWIWNKSISFKRNPASSRNSDDLLETVFGLYVIEGSIISQTNSVYLDESKISPMTLVRPIPCQLSTSLSEAYTKLVDSGLASICVVHDLKDFELIGVLHRADFDPLQSQYQENPESFFRKWPTVGDFITRSTTHQNSLIDSARSMILPIDATIRNAIQLMFKYNDYTADESPIVWIMDDSKHLQASLGIPDLFKIINFFLTK